MEELAIKGEAMEQEIMPSFDFLLEGEAEKNALLAEHRAWLKGIRRERRFRKTITGWRYTFATSTKPAMRIISPPTKSSFWTRWLFVRTGNLSVSMWMREAPHRTWKTLQNGRDSCKIAMRAR